MITNTDIEKYIDENKKLTYRNVGVSMLPMLVQDKDVFTLEKVDINKLKKFDVVLYKADENKYILHRIIKVNEDSFVIRGDNTFTKEYVRKDDIIAKMTSFVHNGKKISSEDKSYKIYSSLWNKIYIFRYIGKDLKTFPYKVYKKIKGN